MSTVILSGPPAWYEFGGKRYDRGLDGLYRSTDGGRLRLDGEAAPPRPAAGAVSLNRHAREELAAMYAFASLGVDFILEHPDIWDRFAVWAQEQEETGEEPWDYEAMQHLAMHLRQTANRACEQAEAAEEEP